MENPTYFIEECRRERVVTWQRYDMVKGEKPFTTIFVDVGEPFEETVTEGRIVGFEWDGFNRLKFCRRVVSVTEPTVTGWQLAKKGWCLSMGSGWYFDVYALSDIIYDTIDEAQKALDALLEMAAPEQGRVWPER